MSGDGRASAAADAHEIVARVIAANGHRPAARITDQLFQELTGIEADALPGLLLGSGELPRLTGARRLRDQLAALLGCGRVEASALLGVSDSRIRRNDYLDREMLDRAHAIIDTYVLVAAAIGPQYAVYWFNTPHSALEGQIPRQLLRTHYGRGLVNDLVSALLAGAYV